MEYRAGEKCANGALRLVNVTVACGLATQVQSVEEDGMCNYRMLFTTPIACGSSGGGGGKKNNAGGGGGGSSHGRKARGGGGKKEAAAAAAAAEISAGG
jgi:hypothetical protein